MNKTVLLVNQFSSASYVSKQFKLYNIKTTALYTFNFDKLPDYAKPSLELFDEQIRLTTDDFETIILALGNAQFSYVINGCDASVELSDKLALHYTPEFANDYNTYKLRSNKYEMHKILSEYGISHIKQHLLNHKTDKIINIEKYDLNYPCFIKPLAAAASIGANKINNPKEYADYFKNVEQYNNFLQNSDNAEQFLISEYVSGEELLVDTFSVKGVHHFSTIQRYKKDLYNGRPIYRYCELEGNRKIRQKIENYMTNVLDKTGFQNGFAHSELFLLNTDEIKLIEINPRVSGAGGMIMTMAHLSHSHGLIDLLAKHILNCKLLHQGNNQHYRLLFLSNLSHKPLTNLKSNLKQYKTVIEILQIVPDGYVVEDKNDIKLTDTCAFVLLSSNSFDEIEADTTEIFYKDDIIGWQ